MYRKITNKKEIAKSHKDLDRGEGGRKRDENKTR